MNRESPQPEPALSRTSPALEVWSVAWPTVLTMTSYTVMQFADKLMVGQVGALEVAAQGNGGIWTFVPLTVGLGVLTVVNTYVSQNLGAGKPENGPRYAWAGMWISAALWLLVMLPFAAVLEPVFDLVHSGQVARFTGELEAADPAIAAAARFELAELDRLVALETLYGRVLLWASLLLLASRTINHYFFGLHRPKVVTVSALVANVANVGANYVLIFGDEGIPSLGLPGVPGVKPLGLLGAAIGTAIGTAVELAIPLAVFLGPKMNRDLSSRAQWRPRLGPIRDLVKTGWPAGLQFANEIFCWSIFMSTMVGVFGANHQTAGWIALTYMHLSFMPAVGFSVAVTSLVGKYIGAGQPDVAAARARLGLFMSMGYMTVCALVFLVFREPLVAAFVSGEVDRARADEIIDIGAKLMICAAVFQTVDALGIVYTGALRGAGDTVWPGVVTVIYSWMFIIAGGYGMIAAWPTLESVGPWIAASAYVIIFGLTMGLRFESGRWRSIRLLEDDTARDAARVAPVGPAPPASDPQASIRDRAGQPVE